MGILIGKIEGRLAAAGQFPDRRVQVIPIQLRIQNAIPSCISSSSHYQLILVYIDGDMFGNMEQCLGPSENQSFAFRLSEGFGK
ncbi:hypothetical protein D3C78_1027430 [compost metagenome]